MQFQKLGDLLGLPKDKVLDFGLKLDLSQNNLSLAKHFEKNSSFVGLILGSSWPSRFWMPKYYAELIVSLKEKYGIRSVLIGGPGEREFADIVLNDPLLDNQQEYFLDLVGMTKLSELPWLFSQMKFAIGSDSGPMHIAAASGIRVISLWGSTSPLRSAPWGSEDLLVEATEPCSPCYKKVCPGFGTACMRSITPSRISGKIESLIG